MRKLVGTLLIALLPAAVWAQEPEVSATPEANAEISAEEVPVAQQEPGVYYDSAVLQGLNKVTARISQLDAAVGTAINFGNLEIIVKRCWQAPQTERPENAALLEIIDRRPGETPAVVFNGWMFSSSPSLSGLEHPVYDVVVLRCEKREMENNQ